MPKPLEPLPPVTRLLPQGGAMLLLDRLISFDENQLVASVDLAKPSVFHDATDLVPTYVGIEYIVQAASALAGAKRFRAGLQPLIGLLLGAREVVFSASHFPQDVQLKIVIEPVFPEASIGVFSSVISHAGNIYVRGQIKAIQPNSEADLEDILEGAH